MSNKTIKIVAAVIIGMMFVIVPTTWNYNGAPMAFSYRFIWDLGSYANSAMAMVPNPTYIIAQIIGVVAITWLLTKK